MLKVDRAPAAKPDARAEVLVGRATKAARDGEPLPEYEEIRFHTADMRQPRRQRKVLSCGGAANAEWPLRSRQRGVLTLGTAFSPKVVAGMRSTSVNIEAANRGMWPLMKAISRSRPSWCASL